MINRIKTSLALSAATAAFAVGFSSSAAFADQVIADDLIVQGSLCAGFDCVNNESFGFDTIRLKENNTRIKFDDTSVGAFAASDWQLTANESASGGLNKFSIEDITSARVPFTVEGGAPTNSLYVNSTGQVGFGTSTPVLDLHAVSDNTPALRLEQNSSGGFTAQTWDVAGNEANFFVRDVTGGSRLPFRIRPGAPTSSIDIASDGDVGIGTGEPASAFHVLRTDNASTTMTLQNSNAAINRTWQFVLRSNDGQLAINDAATAGADFIFAAGPAGGLTVQGDVTCNGTASCFNDNSDIRFKSGIRKIENANAILHDLQPIYWQTEDGRLGSGFSAQEVEAVMKKHGMENWSGHTYKADKDRHFLAYTSFVGIMAASIKELADSVQARNERIEALEQEVRALKN